MTKHKTVTLDEAMRSFTANSTVQVSIKFAVTNEFGVQVINEEYVLLHAPVDNEKQFANFRKTFNVKGIKIG